MTDRVTSLTVFLERPMRVDDAEHLMNALSMIKGVSTIMPNQMDHLGEYTGELRMKNKLWGEVHKIFWPKDG